MKLRGTFFTPDADPENVKKLLQELGIRDGFYAAGDEFEKDFVFSAENGRTRLDVYGEMGENLLSWAKQKNLMNFSSR